MATYGIMRIEKRTRSAVYGLQIEANRKEADQYKRDFFDSDIDWSRTKNNVFIKQTENWNREITRQIKEAGLKERKNSIVLIDGLYTCSPEWFETHTKEEAVQYFKYCISFHNKEYFEEKMGCTIYDVLPDIGRTTLLCPPPWKPPAC